MGVVSRKIFPACVNMCICCPALRSRSRQPVKRYKKLLAEIFAGSPEGSRIERKIAKLCEYAAKNPYRIPKISNYLEERCFKELRYDHIKLVDVVTQVYDRLLSMCKEQMAYFALNLLNVAIELLDNTKQDAVQIIGCQTLTRFIYSQVDGTYAYNIENFVQKLCTLARKTEEENEKRRLRASSLQCLSAMVWFMMEFSHIFTDFDEIVYVTLDNYEPSTHNGEDGDRRDAHHNWVDEVIRCEARVAGKENKSSCMISRPQAEVVKDPSLLTREEAEIPEVWARISIWRMVELAKESTTMRRVLDPMFNYFDTARHWVPRGGLPLAVLSDMGYSVASPGNQQLILASIVHHLDHKNVSHDPETKVFIIHTATALVQQIRCGAVLSDVGFVSDLCRHLRKSLQVTADSVRENELNLNISLQSSIEDCLLETARGICDTRPLLDMMARTLEKLPSDRRVARATTGSMIILAHMISVASVSSHLQQVFPDGLLLQILKLMLHPDVDIRVSGHQIFSILLVPTSNHTSHDASSHARRWHSDAASVFASVTSLLQKLLREKDGTKIKNSGVCSQDDCIERDHADEERKHVWGCKKSPNLHKLSSIIDKNAGAISFVEESSVMKFNEDQVMQLTSAFWMQANLPDNLLSNIEAIANSFCLTLVSLRLGNPDGNIFVGFFQLPLSLWKKSLDSGSGMLYPACKRSLLTLSTAMLMFAAKIYQISDISSPLKPIIESDIDPYLGISEDFQVYVKPQADVNEYCSLNDNQLAASVLKELQNELCKSYDMMVDTLVQRLCDSTELEADELGVQLSETFSSDDAFMFGPHSILEASQIHTLVHTKESLSFDMDFPTNSLVEDDAISVSSVADFSSSIPKSPTPASMSHIISIGQLMESALEVAGHVAGTSISTSPLSFSAMAGQCEALGTDTRKKLSSWLSEANHDTKAATDGMISSADELSETRKILDEDGPVGVTMLPVDPWLALRLPPASPFDVFLRAARP